MQHLLSTALSDRQPSSPRLARLPSTSSNDNSGVSPFPPSSARSKGKRRAPLPWDLDDSDSDSGRRGPTRKHRRCDGSPGFGCSSGSPRASSLTWTTGPSEMTGPPPASVGSSPVAASGNAFGLRSMSRLPSRPAPLSLPARPTSLFRRATSDPPPCSPTTFHVRHDPCFDTLNDALCRAQEAFVQGFADAQSSQHASAPLPLPPAPPTSPSWEMAELSPMMVTYDLLSSPFEMPDLSPDRASSVPSERSPCAIPRAGDDLDGVPDLYASSSETSAASWFTGSRFAADVAESDDDDDDADIIIDPRRHSVDDLSYLLVKTDICRPTISRRGAFWGDAAGLSSLPMAGHSVSRSSSDDLGLKFD